MAWNRKIFLLLWLVCGLTATAESKKLKVGLVLDKGGRDDKSFNASAYLGATEAEKKLGIQLKVVESSDDASLEPSLRTFAQRGFDLVIGIGFVLQAPLEKVAKEFPKVKFLLVDAFAESPNVRSIIFKDHEGAYLVGTIAALTSKTKTVGFVGGMDIPLIRRIELGYRKGIEAAKPGTKLLTNYVGSSSDAWRNPMKAKELALSQYQKSADIIFTPAGASGMGVFDAAEETKKMVIGCDSNQNWIKPGRVLSSMLKRVDKAVFEAVELATQDKFQSGKISAGVKEGMIDYALDQHNRPILTPEVEKQVNLTKEKIINGSIVVPDYYELQKKPAKG